MKSPAARSPAHADAIRTAPVVYGTAPEPKLCHVGCGVQAVRVDAGAAGAGTARLMR